MGNSGKWILGIGVAMFGIGFIILALAFFTMTSALTTATAEFSEEASTGGGERVALIVLDEPIIDSEPVVRQLRKYRQRSSVKAIVLRLDSPGGAVAPSQEIFDEVKRTVASGKPVVVSMGSVAASGAYYIACGATRIVANPGTITGSIGVISEFVSFKGLMDKIGLEQTTVKSGRYKDLGNPGRRMTEDEVVRIQSVIDDVYEQFVEAVQKARSLPLDSVRQLADGRVYSGRQAKRLGLVDTLGTLQTAVTIAGLLGRIEGEPRVVKERKRESLMEQLLGSDTRALMQEMRARFRVSPPYEYRMQYSPNPEEQQ